MKFYDLHFKDTEGREHSMQEYAGKVVLIVNTATRCGLAGQFTELEALHQKYKDQGLVVIGFPSDQFKHQESETNETMVNVCKINFGVTFLLAEKCDMNGPTTHPVFAYLKKARWSLWGNRIKWNFTKFIIDKQGAVIKRAAPTVSPLTLTATIEAALTQ